MICMGQKMADETLVVKMLGEFSLSIGEKSIKDSDNRSRKVWLLLSYIICARSRVVTQEELVNLIWSDSERSSNPVNALKTMTHRMRAMVDALGDDKGKALILSREGGYMWNSSYPAVFDTDEFEDFCRRAEAADEPEVKISFFMKAVDCYKGPFLPLFGSEAWAVPYGAYLHGLYISAVNSAAQLLMDERRFPECVELCRRAIAIEPYTEEIYAFLMTALLAQGENGEAVEVYRQMSELIFDNFAVEPSEELKALYRTASSDINDKEVNITGVRDQLREQAEAPGAFFCDYDFFKVIYRSLARSVSRSGEAAHIGLITVSPRSDKALSKQSLEICMENLKNLITLNLRRGDTASKCSVCQFVMLLTAANYENSCMVCKRILTAFNRQYPHSPAKLSYSVRALEPNVR